MSKNNTNDGSILEQARKKGLATHSAGMTAPDGYFDQFVAKMVDSLPYRAEAEDPEKSAATRASWWLRVRPFVYMAAMFAGIWLMLQMFAMMGGMGQKLQPLESNPIIAAAFDDDDFMYDYLYDDLGSYGIYDNITEEETANGDDGYDIYGDDAAYGDTVSGDTVL